MERRMCAVVIQQMLDAIPFGEANDLKEALKWNLEDSMYKAPELTIQWERTSMTLQKYIPNPIFDWQFKVLSIFTTKSIDELRKIFK